MFRVLEIQVQTGATKVMVSGLHFPNGIQKHPDGESLLIAETSMFRIRRYYFTGPQKGQLNFFVNNLPGLPDNIRLSSTSNDCFYIAICSIRSDEKPSMVDKLNAWPKLRRFLTAFVPKHLMYIAGILYPF
ncbi:Adipocyte plasma membrane-associated protein [Aphelenchoides bicaudatus]|nr:Adipocyte plasma membrane-associated protein [Aphelenchoides bicaudatus]